MIRNFCDNDLLMIVFCFDFSFTADDNSSTTRFVSLCHSVIAIYSSPGWEIRSFDVFHQSWYINFPFRINVCHTSVQYFRQIVRRHIGCHSDSNTRRTINQQIRNTSWQYERLFSCIVEGRLEIYRIFIYVAQHLLCKLAQACFRVTHCSWAVIVHRAKVTLSIY